MKPVRAHGNAKPPPMRSLWRCCATRRWSSTATPGCSRATAGRWKSTGSPHRCERDRKSLGVVLTFRDVGARRWEARQLLQAHRLEAAGKLAAGAAGEYAALIGVIRTQNELLLRRFGDSVAAREAASRDSPGCGRSRRDHPSARSLRYPPGRPAGDAEHERRAAADGPIDRIHGGGPHSRGHPAFVRSRPGQGRRGAIGGGDSETGGARVRSDAAGRHSF